MEMVGKNTRTVAATAVEASVGFNSASPLASTANAVKLLSIYSMVRKVTCLCFANLAVATQALKKSDAFGLFVI